MKQSIYEFFDPYNPEHIKALINLQEKGEWPKGFITEDIEMSPGWLSLIYAKLADSWIACARAERWPTEMDLYTK